MNNFLLSVASLSILIGTVAFAADSAIQLPSKTISFKNASGQDAGKGTLSQTASGLLVRLNLKNLVPGWHAIHLHEKGDCSPGHSFENAGEHFNPDSDGHGFAHEKHHAGDMPNIKVDEKGNAEVEILNDDVSLNPGDDESLLDADGSALVIHTGGDDYKSQPGGNAGNREACAAIMP
ncbi:MAG: superoxide dismutase family protein [Alphaproteobacteria bacterium]